MEIDMKTFYFFTLQRLSKSVKKTTKSFKCQAIFNVADQV